jgi:hypothetical protein
MKKRILLRHSNTITVKRHFWPALIVVVLPRGTAFRRDGGCAATPTVALAERHRASNAPSSGAQKSPGRTARALLLRDLVR